MDLEQIVELAKQIKEIIAALVVAVPLAIKAWHDMKAKAHELREKGFSDAAEDLYQHGEELKADWKAAGKGKKDLVSRLRAMAPFLLMRYGIARGISEEDIQKVLGLSQSIHKARKVFREGGATPVVVALPEAPEGEPDGEAVLPSPSEDPPEAPGGSA
jgi:hypothetical protein